MTEAIILAGGLGSRLRSVVSDVPKPMAPVLGKPFLHHLMNFWVKQGITHFILSTGYKSDIISDYFGVEFAGIPVSYSIEKKLLGTGGGILQAAENLQTKNSFLVINGDTFCDVSFPSIKACHDEKQSALTIVVKEIQNNYRYGNVKMDSSGQVTAFESVAEAEGRSSSINTGIYYLEKSVLAQFGISAGEKASLEKEIFPDLLNKTRVTAYITDGDFIDMGIPTDYARCADYITALSGIE